MSSRSSRSLTRRAVTLVPFSRPESGPVLVPSRHRDGRLVDRDERQRARVLGVGERVTDHDVGDAGDGDDVARPRLFGGLALQRLGHHQLSDLDPVDGAVVLAPRDLLALLDDAGVDAAQRDPAEVGAGVQVGHVRLERGVRVVRGGGDRLPDHLEQRLEVFTVGQAAVVGLVQARPPGPRRGVHDREVDLLLGRVEVEEQLVRLVDHLGDARVGPVDLVDDEDDRQLRTERLAEDEARLRQRPLGGVHEKDHTVDHRQAALDLAAEVGVAGGVDDVDRRTAVQHGGVLRENRDALLALQVVRVHHSLVDVLVLAERTGLPEHGVDEGRLAVVDVGDDGDVAEIVPGGGGHACGSRFVGLGVAAGSTRQAQVYLAPRTSRSAHGRRRADLGH